MSQDQNWRNMEPRIRTREETPPTTQPAQTKKTPGVVEFVIFCVLALVCAGAVVFLGFKESLLGDSGTALASINHPAASGSQQPFLTMEELDERYGHWIVDCWNDDLNAVEVHTWGWLDSGKERGYKEATVRIAPKDYRALKAVALMDDRIVVSDVYLGVCHERAKK